MHVASTSHVEALLLNTARVVAFQPDVLKSQDSARDTSPADLLKGPDVSSQLPSHRNVSFTTVAVLS